VSDEVEALAARNANLWDGLFTAQQTIADLRKRLHDAEAEAAFAYGLRDEEGAALTAERDAERTLREEIEAIYGRTFEQQKEELTVAHARIAALEEALRALLDAYCQTMADQYDFPDSPWTMERGHRRNGAVPDTTALAARALLSPAPADAAHEEETP
jgi:hypothetical protein